MSGLLYCLPLTSSWLQTQGSGSDDHKKLQHCIQCLNNDKRLLVVQGAGKCGKTVLLFQAGVAYANQDYHVTLIGRRPLTHMPLSIHGMIRPDMAGKLQTLTFLYMSKVSDLFEYCASVHTKSIVPDVLIVDDLEFYLEQLIEPDIESGCARLCAVLNDTQAFMASKSSLGIVMTSCNYKHPEWRQIFNLFKFTSADIKEDADEKETYQLTVCTDTVTMETRYQINTSGVFMLDLETKCLANT